MKKIIITFILMIMCVTIVGCDDEAESDEFSENRYYSDEQDTAWDKQWEVIEIPGLSREYEFLYITDSHLILLDGTETEEVKQYAMERMVNFVHDNAFPIEEQFDIWLEEAANEQIDGLLLGGDAIDFPSDANVNYLGERFSNIEFPYIYAIGNHDWTYPWEYMTDYGRENYLTKLSPYMQGNPAVQQIEFEEFVIVAVDNSDNQIAPECIEEYKEILQKGKPVIVMLHVPLLTQSVLTKAREVWSNGVVLGGGNFGGIYPDEVSTEFINLTTAKDSPVVAVLAGHVHFYDRDMINDNIVQLVGDAGYKGEAMWIRVTSGN